MMENVIQVNGKIMVNVEASVKISCMYTYLDLESFLHVAAKMENV